MRLGRLGRSCFRRGCRDCGRRGRRCGPVVSENETDEEAVEEELEEDLLDIEDEAADLEEEATPDAEAEEEP